MGCRVSSCCRNKDQPEDIVTVSQEDDVVMSKSGRKIENMTYENDMNNFYNIQEFANDILNRKPSNHDFDMQKIEETEVTLSDKGKIFF